MNKDDTKTKVVFTDQAAPHRDQLMDMATFHYDHIVDLYPFYTTIDQENHGKLVAKHRLLNSILERMIRIEVQELNPKQKKVTASIDMPFIYSIEMEEKDATIRRLEMAIEHYRRSNYDRQDIIEKYREMIKDLRLPWYKKLWRKIRHD